MRKGTVRGPIVSTKRLWDAPRGALLEIDLDFPAGAKLIAFDVLSCGKDEKVLVVEGEVAAAWFAGKPPPPIDALIIGTLEK
jgi:ethanolamine utilization protein EutN